LQRYHAGGEQDSPLVQFEIREIEQNLEIESSFNSRSSWLDLIKTSANRKRTFIAATVGFFAQWNGIGVISYYLTLVLNTVDITSTRDQALINGLLQVFNYLAATFAGALLVDRAGRRPLFLTSTIGMLLSYIAWTILTSFFTETRNKSLGHAVIAFIFIYNFFYDIAWTPMLQAYPVEIFPFLLRGRGVSVSYISTDIGLIIGQFVNPVAMESIGWKYYIVFCCILALLTAIVYFCYPETKGNTLEEIAEVFEGKRSVSGAGAKQIETGQCVEEQIEYSHDHDGR
jgi:MFS family permease